MLAWLVTVATIALTGQLVGNVLDARLVWQPTAFVLLARVVSDCPTALALPALLRRTQRREVLLLVKTAPGVRRVRRLVGTVLDVRQVLVFTTLRVWLARTLVILLEGVENAGPVQVVRPATT